MLTLTCEISFFIQKRTAQKYINNPEDRSVSHSRCRYDAAQTMRIKCWVCNSAAYKVQHYIVAYTPGWLINNKREMYHGDDIDSGQGE